MAAYSSAVVRFEWVGYVRETKIEFLDQIEDRLGRIVKSGKPEDIYFHDIGHEIVDEAVSGLSTQEGIALIEWSGKEDQADRGVLDTSSVSQFVATLSYECMYAEIFDDDFFQRLQSDLNNEEPTATEAKAILKKIKEHRPEYE